MRKENPKDERERRIAELAYDYDSKPRQRRLDCNLCGGKRFVTLTHRDRYGYAANADGCLRCGLVFLNPVMNAEAYANGVPVGSGGRMQRPVARNSNRPLYWVIPGALLDRERNAIDVRLHAYARSAALTANPASVS